MIKGENEYYFINIGGCLQFIEDSDDFVNPLLQKRYQEENKEADSVSMNTLLNPIVESQKQFDKNTIEIKVIFETINKNFDQKYGKYKFNLLIEHFKPYPMLHEKITKKYVEVKKLIDEGKPSHEIKKEREFNIKIQGRTWDKFL